MGSRSFWEEKERAVGGSNLHSIPLFFFCIGESIFILTIPYKLRGFYPFIEWGNTNFSNYTQGEGEDEVHVS